MGYMSRGGRPNRLWQQIADQTWYVYIVKYDGTLIKRKAEQGQKQANAMAKVATYNPSVKRVTVYSSVIAKRKGMAERFLWTREKGWK